MSFRLLMLSSLDNAHTIRWARSLADRGLDILLFGLDPPSEDHYSGWPNIRVECADIDSRVVTGGHLAKLKYIRALPKIRQLARQFRPNLSHAHYAASYGVLGTLAGLEPFIVSVWGADVYKFPTRSPLHYRAIRRVLRKADRVLSTSHVMRGHTLDIAERPVFVTPFGVDTEVFCPSHSTGQARSGPLVVGTIKHLMPNYGVEYLLRAFAKVLKRSDLDLELMIVGDGQQRDSLVSLAAELSIAHVTTFEGRVSYDEIPACHQNLDIAVYPSVEYESFGVATIESQACGTPVIVSEVGGLPEVVLAEETGVVVPPADVDELANAIERLARDEVLRHRLGEAGRQRVESEYRLDLCVNRMLRVYQDLTHDRLDVGFIDDSRDAKGRDSVVSVFEDHRVS